MDLRAYAPNIVFQKYPGQGVAFPNLEYFERAVKEEHIVYPQKTNFYIFFYNENSKFPGLPGTSFEKGTEYENICDLVLKETFDLYGKGEAILKVGARGEHRLTEFRKIYP